MSSSSISKSSGVLSFDWSSAGRSFGSVVSCRVKRKEQVEARCPFLWHLKQSPFCEQFSCSLEESREIQEVRFMGVSEVMFWGVWGKFGQSLFRCLVSWHHRQSFSLMQCSRSSGVNLEIEGRGSVGFQDIAMVGNLWFQGGVLQGSVVRVCEREVVHDSMTSDKKLDLLLCLALGKG